jgi:hypothetical protein
MAIIRKSGKSLVPPNIEVMVVPIILITVLIILSILVAKIGISKVNSQREKLTVAQRDETIFKQKQEILQEVQGEVLSLADLSASAVPNKNPALAVISQLKNLASLRSVVLSNLQVGSKSGAEKGMSKVDISFDVDGDFSSVLDFLQDTSKIAPISQIEKIEINQTVGATRANTTMVSFWAPFPKKLPPLTEAAKDLSVEELSLIRSLSELTPPVFLEIAPSVPSARADPFAF